mgnify:CR=1 FL=1
MALHNVRSLGDRRVLQPISPSDCWIFAQSRYHLSCQDGFLHPLTVIPAAVDAVNTHPLPRFLCDGSIAPHAIANLVTFGVHFAALTEFPGFMAEAPYSLNAGMIGVAYLAYGVSGLIASPLGGMLSDKAAAQHPTEPEARISTNMLIALLVMPPSLVLFGWSAHMHLHMVAPLVGFFGIGFACAALLPGVFSFCTTLKQAEAAGAAAMIQTMMFVSAGVLILVSAVVVKAIGLGPWFSILAGVQLAAALFAYVQIKRKGRAASAAVQHGISV